VELIELIASDYGYTIGAACFPEVHPEAPDLEHDLKYARRKVDAGASFLITQLFFDNELYFDFVPKARDAGITVPIVPGIMPITNYKQIKTITGMCGATIPAELGRELDERADDPEAVAELGTAYAALQCNDLLARGAPGVHFYTLNKSPATRAILAALRAAHPWTRARAPV
jgi:methylenetetrahydrofolate reductase (NADPH)